MEKAKIKTEFDDFDKREIQERIDAVHEGLEKIDKTPIAEDIISLEFDTYVKMCDLVEDGKYNVDKLIHIFRHYIAVSMKLRKKVEYLFNHIKTDSEIEQIHNITIGNNSRELRELKEQNEELKDRLIEAMQKVIELTASTK